MTINFYRQGRRDGGIRTGADVEGEPVLGIFEPGPTDEDGSLDWYVDVEWRGQGLPSQASALRQFLLSEQPAVAAACARLGERLQRGIDNESAPFREDFQSSVPGAQAAVLCSAIRRVSGRQVRSRLDELARGWNRAIEELAELTIGVP